MLVRESRRLRRLVEGLLNFGRMEAGAIQYRFETIDPAELVRELSNDFQHEVEASGYRIDVEAGPTWQIPPDQRSLTVNLSMIRLIPRDSPH